MTYTAPVTSVMGATGAVTGLVKTVNGVSADAAGNVDAISLMMPDYSAKVSLTVSTSQTTYTAPSHGYINACLKLGNGSNQNAYFAINDTVIFDGANDGYTTLFSGQFVVSKEDKIVYKNGHTLNGTPLVTFVPMKGA